MREVDSILNDPKIPIDKKVSMLYEKSVKGVKEVGSLKKQYIKVKREIEDAKDGILLK